MTGKDYAPLLVVIGLITLAVFVVSVLTPDSREFPPSESASAPRAEQRAPAPAAEAQDVPVAPTAEQPAPTAEQPAPTAEPAPAPPQEEH